jgi:hypothetical protein
LGLTKAQFDTAVGRRQGTPQRGVVSSRTQATLVGCPVGAEKRGAYGTNSEARSYKSPGNLEASFAFGETQHPKDVAVADARSDVRCDWTPMTAPFLSHSECVEVMPRVAFMEKMDQQTLFEKSRIFFHLATLDRGTAPLFEHLAVRYWMTAVALDEQTELRLVSRAPTERTAA